MGEAPADGATISLPEPLFSIAMSRGPCLRHQATALGVERKAEAEAPGAVAVEAQGEEAKGAGPMKVGRRAIPMEARTLHPLPNRGRGERLSRPPHQRHLSRLKTMKRRPRHHQVGTVGM